MKKLILFGIFLSLSVHAQRPEIVERTDAKAVITQIKDLEIGDKIKQTADVKECEKFNEYKKDQSSADIQQNLDAAQKCFQGRLKNKSAEDLKKLSDQLKLQQYGLVPSNNVQEIQKYLTDKLTEALTGVNPKKFKEAQDAKQVRALMKQKKLVDQSVYINLYKTQLGKNALYEVSRYCFENLRNSSTSSTNFGDHWSGHEKDLDDETKLNDLGSPKFGANIDDGKSDTDQVYKNIFDSIKSANSPISDQFLADFFVKCGQAMKKLCDDFKKKADSSQTVSTINSVAKNGAASCLSQSRLREYKEALANADKIIQQMDKESGEAAKFQLAESGEATKLFNEREEGKSLDELTSSSSADFFQGQKDGIAKAKADECEKNPEGPECEIFFMDGDKLNKVKQKIETDMTFRRDVEMERVKKLKKESDQKSLEEYLRSNGFFDLLKDNAYQKMSDNDLAKAIGDSFEAQKIAAISEINSRLSSRQVKADDKQNKAIVGSAVKEGIKQSKEERARLAQVVLFNNIITSHLVLKKKVGNNKYEDVGRNVNAWKKEELGLKSAKVNEQFFEGLKAKDDDGKSAQAMKDGKISGFAIIDQFLGEDQQ